MRANTVYSGGYHPSQPQIQWLWSILESFGPADRARFLRFVTSCSRPPLLGFKSLQPCLAVQQVNDSGRLPTAATCMNLLKLPRYDSREVMEARLRYAIGEGGGFGLS